MKFLEFAILATVAVGVLAGVFGVLDGGWSPRAYVARPGDCYVPPQGDPLYDEHYANNVNVPNCSAFVDRGQAKVLEAQAEVVEAQAERIRTETNIQKIGINLFLLVLFCIAALFLLAIVK
jgi:hypothetical protein